MLAWLAHSSATDLPSALAHMGPMPPSCCLEAADSSCLGARCCSSSPPRPCWTSRCAWCGPWCWWSRWLRLQTWPMCWGPWDRLPRLGQLPPRLSSSWPPSRVSRLHRPGVPQALLASNVLEDLGCLACQCWSAARPHPSVSAVQLQQHLLLPGQTGYGVHHSKQQHVATSKSLVESVGHCTAALHCTAAVLCR